MSQLHAAYILDELKYLFDEKYFSEKLLPLLKQYACFEAESKKSLKTKSIHPQTAVLHNIITSGRPNKASVYLEELFSEILKRTEKQITGSDFSFRFLENDLEKELENAFFAVETRCDIKRSKSEDDRDAFNRQVIEAFCNRRTHQVFSRFFIKNTEPLSRIIPQDENKLTHDEIEIAQKTIPDFIIDLPLEHRGIKGMIIETDPEIGSAGMDYLGIEKKKTLAEQFGYRYIYVKKGQMQEALAQFEAFTFNDYFDRLKKNYELPLYGKTSGKDALQYVLSPLAVARIQKTVCELIFAQQLDPEAKAWEIAVIERDVPAAGAAFDDLRKQYNYICDIQGVSKQFPDIDLDIYTTPEFSDAKLHKASKKTVKLTDDFDSKKDYDLLIDLSILQTNDYDSILPRNAADNLVKIRSAGRRVSDHQFYFGKNLNFFNTDDFLSSEAEAAITSLVQNIFRRTSVGKEDMREIFNALTGHDAAVFQSPGKNSHLSQVLFSLLKAGTTVWLCPNNVSLWQRFQTLRNLEIDACLYLNDIKHRFKDKKKAARDLLNRQALILFTTPDYFRSPFFADTVEAMKANDINFSGFLVEGISAVSEYSPDFNPLYKGMVDYARNLLKTKGFGLTVRAAGQHADYAVIEDIKADLQIDKLINRPMQPRRFDADITISKTTGITDTEIIRRKAFENKQKALAELIKALPDKGKILILYPYKSSKYGEYYQSMEASLREADDLFGGQDFRQFSETSIFYRESFSTEEYIESRQALSDFVRGDCRILAATEAIVFTEPVPVLKHIILFNLPDSPDTLYRISGLFGNNLPENTLHVLHDASEILNKELSDAATADGKQESMEEMSGTNPDLLSRALAVKLSFPGRSRDLRISGELLNNPEWPQTDLRRKTENALVQEFDTETELLAAPEDMPKRIYAGKGNKIIGYYDFEVDIANTDNTTYSEQFAKRILYFIKDKAAKYEGGSQNFLKDFSETKPARLTEGIVHRFDGMKNGERAEIEFYLHNDSLNKALELIEKYAGYAFGKDEMQRLFETSRSGKDFFKRLTRRADVNYVDHTIDLPAELRKLYRGYRDTAGTYTALGRFYDLGIIDSYNTDTSNRRVWLKFTKHSENYYKERLKVILSKYLAEEKAEEIFRNLTDYAGETIINKVLNFLINFTYDEIRESRITAAETMNHWAAAIADNDTAEIREAEIENFFYAVFRAKYINSVAPDSLINQTEDFETGSFNTAMIFIYKAEYLKTNIEHLYLSSDKAQKVYPDNSIVLLLNAFARFRKFGDKDFDTAFRRLYLGFEAMEKNEDISYEESIRRRKLFLDILYKYNSKIKNRVDPLIYLKTHTEKLSVFNRKFLKGLREQA